MKVGQKKGPPSGCFFAVKRVSSTDKSLFSYLDLPRSDGSVAAATAR